MLNPIPLFRYMHWDCLDFKFHSPSILTNGLSSLCSLLNKVLSKVATIRGLQATNARANNATALADMTSIVITQLSFVLEEVSAVLSQDIMMQTTLTDVTSKSSCDMLAKNASLKGASIDGDDRQNHQ